MSSELDLDFSTVNFPEDRIWYRISDWELILKVITLIPITVFGVWGNVVILYLIHQNRALRTPTNLLVANMAVADAATLFICPVMFMFNDFYQNYVLGAVGCHSQGFLEASLLMTAVLSLSAVSYDRLTAIVLPMEARLTIRGAKVVIALTWLFGFALATPLAIFRTYKVRVWKNFIETYCKDNPYVLPKYWYVLISALVWFPLGVMLISYTAIFVKLDLYEKRIMKRDHPLTVSYKKTVAKTLFIVVIVFIVLRVPFTVLVFIRANFWGSYSGGFDNGYMILWYTANYLMFLNAAINPLIYGYTNDNFRRAYDQTPICKCTGSRKDTRDGGKDQTSWCACCHIWSRSCARSANIELGATRSNITRSRVEIGAITMETPIDLKETITYSNDGFI